MGADVALEAVGVPQTFELAAELIRPCGRVANIGVHGKPATLHLEKLWTRDVTITTGLVDTFSIPQLLRLITSGRLDPSLFATHRFALQDTMTAYDTFADAANTTVVKILSTLLTVDAGTAIVNGFDVPTQPAKVRESISLTGQFAAVDEILTGRENLVLVARLRHLQDPGRIADGLLQRFALTDAAARKVSTYSGGMRRRLDIAMSLIGDPPVVFLDEPTTGLDPQGRVEVWQAVRELAAGGTTVLLTTQYLVEAEQLADRIAVLHEGRIIVNGTLTELRQLFPPAKVEYVEKQPTLEDIFLALVGDDRSISSVGTEN